MKHICAAWAKLSCFVLFALWFVVTACSTPEVNPPAPRTNTGYIDFYTDSDLELSWEVKSVDDQTRNLRTVFSKFQPIQGNTLRLAAAPGSHRYQVWFINQATTGPQT